METFASMRKFYLCEAGDTMFDFLSELFDKLKHGHHDRHWQESLQLNYQLQTAVGPRFPNDADRLVTCIRIRIIWEANHPYSQVRN